MKHIRTIALVLQVAAMFTGSAGISAAAPPVETGAIYEITVNKIAVQQGNKTLATSATARLRTSPMADGKTSVVLELPSGRPELYQVPAASIPTEFASITGGRDLWFNTAQENYRYNEPLRYDLTDSQGEAKVTGKPTVYPVTVYDGTGKSATGVTIDVMAGNYRLYTATPDDEGHMDIVVPGSLPKANPNSYFNDPFGSIRLRATDASGQVEELRFPDTQFNQGNTTTNWTEVYLSLAPRDTASPVFKARIQQADTSPAGVTRYSTQWLSYPGMGGAQIHNGSILYTSPDGSLCIGIPVGFLRAAIGADAIPPNSQLRINLPSKTEATLRLNQEESLVLKYSKALKFQLQDADGLPLKDLKKNYTYSASLRRFNGKQTEANRGEYIGGSMTVVDAENAIINAGDVPLPGTFTFEMNGIQFQSRAITADEGDGLPVVWRAANAQKVIKGRILAAESGAPLPDVYVIRSNEGSTDEKLVNFNTDQLDKLYKQWQEKSARDSVLQKHDLEYGNFQFIYSVMGMMRTNANGEYSLPFTEGTAPNGFQVFIPGRMGATAELYKWQPDAEGNYALPDVALPLAGSIKASAHIPDRIPDPFLTSENTSTKSNGSILMIGASFDRNTSDTGLAVNLPQLNSSKTDPWILITHTGWISPGSVATIPVPAGMAFGVFASAPNTPTLAGIAWPKQSPLQPGEVRELGAQALSLRTPFVIQVRNPDGTPASGISIRLDGRLPVTTDAEGNAIGWADGTVQRIEAYKDSNTWSSLGKLENIDVEALPEPRTVSITLSK